MLLSHLPPKPQRSDGRTPPHIHGRMCNILTSTNEVFWLHWVLRSVSVPLKQSKGGQGAQGLVVDDVCTCKFRNSPCTWMQRAPIAPIDHVVCIRIHDYEMAFRRCDLGEETKLRPFKVHIGQSIYYPRAAPGGASLPLNLLFVEWLALHSCYLRGCPHIDSGLLLSHLHHYYD